MDFTDDALNFVGQRCMGQKVNTPSRALKQSRSSARKFPRWHKAGIVWRARYAKHPRDLLTLATVSQSRELPGLEWLS